MRPITRGPSPSGASTWSSYSQARGPLEAKFGRYCSYCELELKTGLHVEHVRPKSVEPSLLLKWDNFLLACVHCNSRKGSQPVVLNEYLWPDADNTFLAYTYSSGALVSVRKSLPAGPASQAQKTFDLVGLGHIPATTGDADRRWERRYQAWDTAERARDRLAKGDTPLAREWLVEVALGTGCFSVWMTIFDGDDDIKQRLVAAFPGTASDCFNAGNPTPRPGGYI
jgi:uncharacterized protein (TIGR02646 family)